MNEFVLFLLLLAEGTWYHIFIFSISVKPMRLQKCVLISHAMFSNHCWVTAVHSSRPPTPGSRASCHTPHSDPSLSALLNSVSFLSCPLKSEESLGFQIQVTLAILFNIVCKLSLRSRRSLYFLLYELICIQEDIF